MGRIENLAERVSKSELWYEKGNPLSETFRPFIQTGAEILIYTTIFFTGIIALSGAYEGIKYLINNF